MDMKSYILVGGGLLICLVLLHALVSAWRANRRRPDAEGVDVEPDDLDLEAADHTEVLWNEDAEAERVGEPRPEELVADAEPGPPVLMESTDAADDTAADFVTEAPPPDVVESNPDETFMEETTQASLETTDALLETTQASQTAHEGSVGPRKGRRIEIAGKRTEPTVPRAMRPEFHEFVPPEPKESGSETSVADSLDEIIVVWVFARPGRLLHGETLFKTFVSHGLKCDSDRVFKKTDPRCGGPWYAVANGVEPGTFDISRPAALETPGVVMLLNLGEVRDPGPAFEDMLDVAQDLAIALDAELKDERMSDMSAQTIEHCRQRIRDHRRMLLRA